MKNTANLISKKKVGGSIIERRPVFTTDGKYLCVIEKGFVRAYNTRSGECAVVLDIPHKVHDDIVGIGFYNDILFGISSSGILMQWSLKTKTLLLTSKLKLPLLKFTIFDIVIFYHGHGENNSPTDLCILMSKTKVKPSSKVVRIISFAANNNEFQRSSDFIVKANYNQHSVTFGGQYENSFVGTINENELSIYSYKTTQLINRTMTRPEQVWTVIRAHPIEDCIAVGDNFGCITLFHISVKAGINRKNLPRSFYKWHVLPVTDIAFSPEGTHMFSGGSECVMVKWDIYTPQIRHFLPRLSAPVAHYTVSPNNEQIAVALKNNSILLVHPQLSIDCWIQQFTWSLINVAGQELLPAGISLDPNTDSLILNGRTGHVQFLSLKTSSLIYNLDITESNYLTQERDTQIYNVEVTRVALSQDGKWMATVEERKDPDASPEIRLKIWNYDSTDLKFKLNTHCELPHQDFINVVKFQPIYSLDNEKRSDYCLVTTSNDKKFRVWLSSVTQIENKKHSVWKCERTGFYKDFPAGPAGFSSDGSVLAVGFGPCLTVWDVDNHQLVASLTCSNENLTFVEIEQTHYSHLIVGTTVSELRVWNLLTLTTVWTVPLNVSILVADPLSEYMAVFTADNILFVFKPSNSEPVYEKNYICPDGKTMAAIFVPQKNVTNKTESGLPNWMKNSQLYFITSTQELFCIELDDGNSYEKPLKQFSTNDDDNLAMQTPFASIKAKQVKIMEGDSSAFKNRGPVGLGADNAIRKLLSAPIHTMPQINLFCNEFLKSFITKSSSREGNITNKGIQMKIPDDAKKKNKKKINKLKAKIMKEQKEEFEKMFSLADHSIESMDVDNTNEGDDNDVTHDSIGQFDFIDVDNDDSESDNEKNNSVSNISPNRMYTNMKTSEKSGDKISKKRANKKRTRKRSKSDFVIDDTPDLGLLNLFKHSH